MTCNEQALFALMQERGFSHGTCVTALHILCQSPAAVSTMLAYLYDEHPSETEFIHSLAGICETQI